MCSPRSGHRAGRARPSAPVRRGAASRAGRLRRGASPGRCRLGSSNRPHAGPRAERARPSGAVRRTCRSARFHPPKSPHFCRFGAEMFAWGRRLPRRAAPQCRIAGTLSAPRGDVPARGHRAGRASPSDAVRESAEARASTPREPRISTGSARRCSLGALPTASPGRCRLGGSNRPRARTPRRTRPPLGSGAPNPQKRALPPPEKPALLQIRSSWRPTRRTRGVGGERGVDGRWSTDHLPSTLLLTAPGARTVPRPGARRAGRRPA
jgi:hypothetical protein